MTRHTHTSSSRSRTAPIGRADLERRAGGNPSWNTGVDYRRQLAKSSQTRQVLAAYRAAGLDVNADLARLNAAPRIAADPAAVRYLRQYGVPTGDITVPVVTVHTVGDGGAVPDLDRWYGDRVRREGNGSKLRGCGTSGCHPGWTRRCMRRYVRMPVERRQGFQEGGEVIDLHRVPHRVGIAGGQSKHTAIHAALLGEWVNVLLTDTGTAESLLGDSAGAPDPTDG